MLSYILRLNQLVRLKSDRFKKMQSFAGKKVGPENVVVVSYIYIYCTSPPAVNHVNHVQRQTHIESLEIAS